MRIGLNFLLKTHLRGKRIIENIYHGLFIINFLVVIDRIKPEGLCETVLDFQESRKETLPLPAVLRPVYDQKELDQGLSVIQDKDPYRSLPRHWFKASQT